MNAKCLEGIHAKVRRAEEQIQKITDEADKLCKDVRKDIIREVHDDVNEQVWVYQGSTPSVPVEWSVIIGEILYNMRSALDHLVWQLVITNQNTPGRNNEFPIATDHDHWQKLKDRTLKGVSQRHQTMIWSLQPFTGGIGLPFGVSKLTVLDNLSNIEKHRHIVVAVLAANGIEPINFENNQPDTGDLDSSPPLKGSIYNARIEQGKILARFNRQICLSFRVDLRLSGEDQLWTMGASLPAVLANCLKTVKGSVDFLTAA